MMKKKILFVVIAIFWLVCIGWLLRYEAFPSFFTRTIAGYKDMLSDDILMTDSWMLISFNDAPIGYSHTRIETDDSDPVFYYEVNNEMQLKLPLMGEHHEVAVETVAHLDVMHQLQKFTFSMSSKVSDSDIKKENLITVKAVRRRGNHFAAAIISPHSTHQTWLEVPPDTIIHSPMTEMALKKLRPGQTMSLRTLEPTTLSTTVINVKAVRKENITVQGITYDATLLDTEYQGVSVKSWIDEEGSIIKQETPFGWNMQKCNSEQALNAILGETSEDILKGMAIRPDGTIKEPRNTVSLTLRLTGVKFTRPELTSSRQTVERVLQNGVVLRSIKLTPENTTVNNPEESSIAKETKDSLKQFLEPSSFIQSDNPQILSQAQRITANKQSDIERASAIFNWVHKNVEKQMTVSLPSALDVLNNMSGDCNEHTYLFTALARASGIPAKIKIGLAFHLDAFYYHAWPAVYLNGKWVEMDPTWGQEYVDATHLAFVEGELADQMAIIRLLGQLKIEVIEVKHNLK